MSELSDTELDIHRLAYNSALAGIAVADLQGTLRKVNPAFVDMWGYDEEDDVVGRSVAEFWSDQQKANSVATEVVENGEWSGELLAESKNGTTFHTDVSASVLTTEEGEPVAIMSAFVDISERKARERELEEQRDSLELLNEIVRHDIRNDLQLVTGYAELLKSHVDDDVKEYLETVQESASSGVELTKTARDLSIVMLQGDYEMESVDLVPILTEEVEETRNSFPYADIAIEDTIPQTAVEADEFLGSVFRNLLKNAVQHNDKERPEVTVTVERNGDHLEVRIADNGPGITSSQKQKIFERGEKSLESEGTGIGLYLVQSLMDAYDGDVWVEDNDPEGAVFVVKFHVAT